MTMTPRERVAAAMHFRRPDKAPVQYYYCPVGYYEHGDKLNRLYESLPGDFEPWRAVERPVPPPSAVDGDGRYHEFRRDEFGTLWEYRIFGITGIPCEHPLADISKLGDFRFPAPPVPAGEGFERDRAALSLHKQRYYALRGAGGLLEPLLRLRPDEDLYCDIAEDTAEINELCDRLADYYAAHVEYAVAVGADGVAFGDDYGTERGLLINPARWREFFKPRLARMFAPALKAGLDIHFHSCGNVDAILGDLRELGATSIWPQLPAYDMKALADKCRALGLAVAVHTDRARTMTSGTPAQVRELVLREFETFRMDEGGAWFYVEADNGFPFENLEALVQTIAELRG